MIKEEYKRYLIWGVTAFLVIVCSVLFFFLIYRAESLSAVGKTILNASEPIIYGLIIAYILGPVMELFQKRLNIFLKGRIKAEKRREAVAKSLAIFIALTIGCMAVAALIGLIFPRLLESIRGLIDAFPGYIPKIEGWLAVFWDQNKELFSLSEEAYQRLTYTLENWITTDFLQQMNVVVAGLTTGIIGIFSSLFNFIIGIIVSIYVLNGKERFVGQGKKILYALCKPNTANNIITIVRQSNKIFGGFISGKLIDSLIIGVICFIGLSLMGTPYTVLVSVIVGVTNIIPFFGPYIGAIPSALLILLADPRQCIYFIIFIIVLQQVDGNIIGPKILGDSTGLSAFWVVFAILLGGGLFGIIGMIIGVPAFAVIYYMIKTFIEWRLRRKLLPESTAVYAGLAYIEPEKNLLVYPESEVHMQKRKRKKQAEEMPEEKSKKE